MSRAEHTPGPWTVELPPSDQDPEKHIRGAGGEWIAYVRHGRRAQEQLANARLIAAAPDLLAACEAEEAVDRHWHECEECDSREECGCDELCRLVDVARDLRRAALARARGGQP